MPGFYLEIIFMASDIFLNNRDAWIPLVNDLEVISVAGDDFLVVEMPVSHPKIISLTGSIFSDNIDT